MRVVRSSPTYRNLRQSLQMGLHRLPRYYGAKGWTDADPYKLIEIEPQAINRTQLVLRKQPGIVYENDDRRFHKYQNVGQVVDGDWDRQTEPFANDRVYKLLCERFGRGVAWRETVVYRELVTCIAEGTPVWHDCRSEEDILVRCRRMDALYDAIKQQGYCRQSQLRPRLKSAELDEITVNIGRDGSCIYNSSGAHRLSIAKILGLRSVPVRVLVRHRKWQDVRDEIRRARSEQGLPGEVLARLSHPDIADIVPPTWARGD